MRHLSSSVMDVWQCPTFNQQDGDVTVQLSKGRRLDYHMQSSVPIGVHVIGVDDVTGLCFQCVFQQHHSFCTHTHIHEYTHTRYTPEMLPSLLGLHRTCNAQCHAELRLCLHTGVCTAVCMCVLAVHVYGSTP